MSKIRNSLGAVVLPYPVEGTLTWEEYKTKFGIDIDQLVDITESMGVKYVKWKRSLSKPIYISMNGMSGWDEFPIIATPIYGIRQQTDPDTEEVTSWGLSLTIPGSYYEDSHNIKPIFALYITADRYVIPTEI